MRTIRIKNLRLNRRQMALVLEALRNGGVVAAPTETSYGLLADAGNAVALRRIFAIKRRDESKQLPLVAASLEQTENFVRLSKPLLTLAKKHWPAPLTLIGASIARGGVYDNETVAIRVPALKIIRDLAAAYGSPLTATSANISGRPAAYSGSAVRKIFSGRISQPDILIDAGHRKGRAASTIVGIEDNRLKVLRPGPVQIAAR